MSQAGPKWSRRFAQRMQGLEAIMGTFGRGGDGMNEKGARRAPFA